MIKIEGLRKIYKGTDFEVEALKDICLEIHGGEFAAIMGASGSGKTSLLNCMGLMTVFDEGEYYLDGIAVHKQPAGERDALRKKYISFIFQDYALMRNYTLYENIELPLLARNVRRGRRKERILSVAERFGIQDILKKRPYQVSGGQQQRAAIARAIAADTPIILADEPTGALDRENAKELMEVLLSLKDLDRTIVMVTHDEKIAEYSDRIIDLEEGRIRQGTA